MSDLVVRASRLGVSQYFVRLLHFLESLLRFFITFVRVGVILFRERVVSLFYISRTRASVDAKNLVIAFIPRRERGRRARAKASRGATRTLRTRIHSRRRARQHFTYRSHTRHPRHPHVGAYLESPSRGRRHAARRRPPRQSIPDDPRRRHAVHTRHPPRAFNHPMYCPHRDHAKSPLCALDASHAMRVCTINQSLSDECDGNQSSTGQFAVASRMYSHASVRTVVYGFARALRAPSSRRRRRRRTLRAREPAGDAFCALGDVKPEARAPGYDSARRAAPSTHARVRTRATNGGFATRTHVRARIDDDDDDFFGAQVARF